MADLLDGSRGYLSHAPISHADSLAITRHLEEKIAGLQAGVDELGKGLSVANVTISDMQARNKGADRELGQLQDGFSHMQEEMSVAHKSFQHTSRSVQQLRASVDETNTRLNALHDRQNVERAFAEHLQRDLTNNVNLTNKIKHHCEHEIDVDLRDLRNELSRTNMDLRNLQVEQETTRGALKREQDQGRELKENVKEYCDNLALTNTHIQIMEQRLTENTDGLKASKRHLEEVGTAMRKLHEDIGKARASLAKEFQGSFAKVFTQLKDLQDNAEKTEASLGAATDRLDQHHTYLSEDLRLELTEVRDHMAVVTERLDRAAAERSRLEKDLKVNDLITQAVKEGLAEQSSLLLPNLAAGHDHIRENAKKAGLQMGITPTGKKKGIGLGGGTPSPRRPRPVSENMMAWT